MIFIAIGFFAVGATISSIVTLLAVAAGRSKNLDQRKEEQSINGDWKNHYMDRFEKVE